MDDSDSSAYSFDMSISTLTRINYWLWKCNEYQFNDDVHNWFKALKIVFKEIDPVARDTKKRSTWSNQDEMDAEEEKLRPKKKEKSKPDSQVLYELFKDVKNAYRKFVEEENNWKQNPKSQFRPSEKIFNLLSEWELTMRNILQKHELYLKKEDDEDDDLQYF